MTRSAASRIAALVAALALPLAAAAQVQDLLDAYRLARAGDPVLRAAEANLRSVGEGVIQARAPLLPQAAAGVAVAQTHGPDLSASSASVGNANVRSRAPRPTRSSASRTRRRRSPPRIPR